MITTPLNLRMSCSKSKVHITSHVMWNWVTSRLDTIFLHQKNNIHNQTQGQINYVAQHILEYFIHNLFIGKLILICHTHNTHTHQQQIFWWVRAQQKPGWDAAGNLPRGAERTPCAAQCVQWFLRRTKRLCWPAIKMHTGAWRCIVFTFMS